jgi:hypothetical protein
LERDPFAHNFVHPWFGMANVSSPSGVGGMNPPNSIISMGSISVPMVMPTSTFHSSINIPHSDINVSIGMALVNTNVPPNFPDLGYQQGNQYLLYWIYF